MNTLETDDAEFSVESIFYKEFLVERDEILRHKWIESEKAGQDIGFEKALLDWVARFRSRWLELRRHERGTATPPRSRAAQSGANFTVSES
jgi:hypothetical protein